MSNISYSVTANSIYRWNQNTHSFEFVDSTDYPFKDKDSTLRNYLDREQHDCQVNPGRYLVVGALSCYLYEVEVGGYVATRITHE